MGGYHHTGGAARYAYKHFGAEWGVGIGPNTNTSHIDRLSILSGASFGYFDFISFNL